MLRTLTFALAMLAVPVGLAQTTTTYDPKIAYTQVSGKAQYLYLANADGSRAVRVATAVGHFGGGVDFAPGGGRIAFADNEGLKVLSYTASNGGIAVLGVQLLVPSTIHGRLGPPDFSADGSRIIYASSAPNISPQALHVVTVPGGVEVLTYPCYLCEDPRWLRPADLGEAFAFFRWNDTVVPNALTREIWTGLVNADGTVTVGPVVSTSSQAFKGMEDFDTARTRNSLLITANYPTSIRLIELDLATGIVTDKGVTGFRAHFSADDSQIVFRNVPVKGSAEYVQSINLSTGVITRLTGRGTFGVTDARP